MDAPRGFQPWMRLGVPELDHDHQKILAACDLFADAIAVGDRQAAEQLLDALIGAATEHFVNEERILIANGYPMAAGHIRLHDEARRRLQSLAEEFRAGQRDLGGIASEIKSFFLDTLIPEDLHCRAFVRDRPQAASSADVADRLATDLFAKYGEAACAIAEDVRASLDAAGAGDQVVLWDGVVSRLQARAKQVKAEA